MTTVERARRLAGERPDGPVPCPECAAEVKGANLERHFTKVHDGAVGAHQARWGGPERVGSRWLLGLALAAAAVAEVFTAASGDPDDRIILGAGAVASLAILVWGAVAWGAPLFPGLLAVDEHGAVLRHSFGLARRRLGSIDEVVIGTAMESRPSGNAGTTTATRASMSGSAPICSCAMAVARSRSTVAPVAACDQPGPDGSEARSASAWTSHST